MKKSEYLKLYCFLGGVFICVGLFQPKVSFSQITAEGGASGPLKKAESFYADLLMTYVDDGLVNYKELSKDSRMKEYARFISNVNPDLIDTEKERLSFWINVYNAFTLKIVSENYPIRSINELHTGGLILGTALKKTVWDKPFIKISNKVYALNDIEHKIIRKEFKEPRIHFALVCAAVSCPPLRAEPYLAEKLDKQLDDQARIFLENVSQNTFDLKNKRAKLSSILNWYLADFGNNKTELLEYVAAYVSGDIRESILTDSQAWSIKFHTYNWDLNEQE